MTLLVYMCCLGESTYDRSCSSVQLSRSSEIAVRIARVSSGIKNIQSARYLLIVESQKAMF